MAPPFFGFFGDLMVSQLHVDDRPQISRRNTNYKAFFGIRVIRGSKAFINTLEGDCQ